MPDGPHSPAAGAADPLDLGALRESYETAGLDIASMHADPLMQFRAWIEQAVEAEVAEANAMHVATIGDDGTPRNRVVLIKAVTADGFVFHTNYDSDKGRQLAANPACALTFVWLELRRQVRITGRAERLDPSASDAYFASRPRGSQLGAWTSPQSSVIADRQVLVEREAEMQQRFADGAVPRPPNWGGILVRPTSIEFWQGRPNRLHDRIRYRLADAAASVDLSWITERLAP